MAGVGAAQTAVLSPPLRFAYWFILMLAGTSFGLSAQAAARRWRIFPQKIFLEALAVSVLMWIPQSLVVLAVQRFVAGTPLTVQIVGEVVALVLLVSMAVTAVNYAADRPPAHTQALPGAEPPRFFARVPPRLRAAELFAVEAEDHYLRLHTSLGQDLVLMRLADAVAELEGIEGAQVHRSWWVARDGYVRAERGRGGARLVLKDGAEAPVSRTFVSTLRAAGWF